jgi:S-methylmethionine-dependent homocysteine/selenocysteine methylase
MLPQLSSDLYLSDGGLETTLVFLQGRELPEFAAFPLLEDESGRDVLRSYFEPFLDLAARHGLGLILDTPTWRANRDWGAVLGYDAERLADVNRRAVDLVADIARSRPDVPTVLNGVIGPRGDGYVVGHAMTAPEAADYHRPQAQAFASAGAQMMSAVTMNYVAEAIGIVRAGVAAGVPTVVSFTVETDGALPSGQALGDAVREVDAATDGGAAYFMINCAHPTHFEHVLDGGEPWLTRVKAVRANSSTMSHDELDAAEELDRGDVDELAEHYLALSSILPDLRVVGGCCGTDLEHITRIAEALSS